MSNIALRQTNEISTEQVDILRKTLFKGFNDDEMKFSLAVCQRTGLDPFVKQIYFTKRKNRTTGEETIVITTGIDGFRLTANRSNAYAGSDEAKYKQAAGNKFPDEATVTVYKIVQGIKCAFTATARWIEYFPQNEKDQFMWRKMPFTMLAKCAEALALRKAFPVELSNIYAHEEMAQASSDKVLVPTKADQVNRMLEAANMPDLEIDSNPDPEEPDFVTDAATQAPSLGDYAIPIGKKYVGKKLSDLSADTLSSFVDWVEKNVTNKNAATMEFLNNAKLYLEEAK